MDDEEIRDDLEEKEKPGKTRRKKPMSDDDLIDPLEEVDVDDGVGEEDEEDESEEDEY